MRLPVNPFLVVTLCLGGLLALAGCGGGGGDSDEPPAPSGGWVTITTPTTEPEFTEYCNEAYLAGEAFVSPDWSAVGSDGTVVTGVTVTWYNAATGASGAATQRADICYLLGTPYPCNHTWSASPALAVGTNEIRVTATDPDGRTGTDAITIHHPEVSYSVSGTVETAEGIGLSFRDSQLDLDLVNLSDSSSTRRTVTSTDGSYRFSCVRSAFSYTITPSSPIHYEFAPQTRTVVASDFWQYYTLSPDGWSGEVVINGADVTDRDFLATHQ